MDGNIETIGQAVTDDAKCWLERAEALAMALRALNTLGGLPVSGDAYQAVKATVAPYNTGSSDSDSTACSFAQSDALYDSVSALLTTLQAEARSEIIVRPTLDHQQEIALAAGAGCAALDGSAGAMYDFPRRDSGIIHSIRMRPTAVPGEST